MAMTHSLAIATRRGLKLAGLYDEPDGSILHPLVILLHGNTGWKDERHLATLAEGLALSGIAALRFDASGSGASEGTWADDYRVSNYVEAVLDVLDYTGAHLAIDRERIGLWSHSMGGIAAATAARLRPEFAALCFSQPATGNMDISPEELRHWRDTGWFEMQTERFGAIELPIEFYDDRGKHDILAAIKGVWSTPVLVDS